MAEAIKHNHMASKKKTAATSTRSASTRKRPRPRAPLARRIEELERRCQELERRAETSEQTRAEMLTVVTHDLRNPLGVIMVTATLLARELQETGGRKQLDAIKRAADEINRIVEDLNDAASIEAGRLALGQDVHDVASIVDSAVAAATSLTAHKPISLVKELSPALPPLWVDKSRVLQVITRLVGNAVRFMPHKGGSIIIRAEPASEGARFSIEDTGPGIPEDQRTQLFSRHAGRRPCQGTGLSVYVAKGIIEAHGGAISAESEVGRGSTIYFTLPAADPAQLKEHAR